MCLDDPLGTSIGLLHLAGRQSSNGTFKDPEDMPLLPNLSSMTKNVQQSSPQTQVEVTHWGKAFATKADDLKLISGTHLAERKSQLPPVLFSDHYMCAVACKYIYILHAHKDPHRDFATESSSLENYWFG